jgi:hypothetical protein
MTVNLVALPLREGLWITEFYVYIILKYVPKENICDMGFPHSPQVSPQVKTGKPLKNRGFLRG